MNSDYQYYLAIGAEGVFYVLLLIFTIHLLFLSYHWFSYGTSRTKSMTALATYLIGGAILLIIMAISMSLI